MQFRYITSSEEAIELIFIDNGSKTVMVKLHDVPSDKSVTMQIDRKELIEFLGKSQRELAIHG